MYMIWMVELLKSLLLQMTNLRFIKKSRHPRRNIGGNSAREYIKEEKKSFYFNDITSFNIDEKKNSENYNKNWNQFNFK
jgi:hypothetical protein